MNTIDRIDCINSFFQRIEMTLESLGLTIEGFVLDLNFKFKEAATFLKSFFLSTLISSIIVVKYVSLTC